MVGVNQRRAAIQALIKKHSIENQQMLVELLFSTYQIETNQSIVSRDIREMGIVKRKVKDQLVYELSEIDATAEILRLSILKIQKNESLIVIKTLGGLASFVGDIIDSQDQELNILGTVAGENTVFVTPTSVQKISTTYQTICELLHFKPDSQE
jgi:transcriptional regulator of arginine metabolism